MKQLLLLLFSLLSNILWAQIRYQDAVFDQVSITQNINYSTNATVITAPTTGQAVAQPLMLDFYEPTGDTVSARPLVLVLPGGMYLPKSVNGNCEGSLRDSAVVEICTRLAKMGYVAAAVDYRLGWNPTAAQQLIRMLTYVQAMYRGVQDARSAIRFFKKSVAEDANPFRVDTTRIVLWGDAEGGQVALSAAYARTAMEWADPNLLIIPPNIPIINPAYLGNIWGTDVGVLDAAGQALYGLPSGDTLCYPNWSGYSSDFQLCVSMSGLIPDLPWIEAGEIPAVLFHAPNDWIRPCWDGLFTLLPPLSFEIVPVMGSCAIAAQLDLLGNNQLFRDAQLNDCISNNANLYNGDMEGFYPFTGLSSSKGRPWQWTALCNNNPSGATDGTFARKNLDTVFAYFAPRACVALGLGTPQADPTGLCGPQVTGKTYLDLNQNDTIDLNEPYFPGVVLELQPIGKHAVSTASGRYSIGAPPGNYVLKIPNPPNYYTPTDTAKAVTVSAGSDVIRNFGLFPTTIANDLQVFLTPLSVARPGFGNTFAVHWKNVGTTQLSGNVSVTIDPGYSIQGSNLPVNIAGNVATWDFTNLNPLETGSVMLQLLLAQNVALGTFLSSSATVTATGVGDETPADNVATTVEEAVGSFDPNDKKVVPEGDVTADIFQEYGGWMDYTIRFQNTGTASAINVYLVDTLSELLNINSLEFIGASHPMRWQLEGQGILSFFFDNINLPDSLNNEPESHGFARFRIKPRLSFPNLLNKTLRNFADIYFDFNDPVRTNTAETRFTEANPVYDPEALVSVNIIPNPANDFAWVSWPMGDTWAPATLQVMDANGAQVFLHEISALNKGFVEKISLKNWPKGVYFVQFLSKSRVVSGRFVKS